MDAIDKNAKSTIILSLVNFVISKVVKETTIPDLWERLKNLYMKKISCNYALYELQKKKKFTMKMVEDSSLDQHID